MKKKATIITYGCQMNVNESAKLKKLLQEMQYEIIDDINDSDAVFLNTCTVSVITSYSIHYTKLYEGVRGRADKNRGMDSLYFCRPSSADSRP